MAHLRLLICRLEAMRVAFDIAIIDEVVPIAHMAAIPEAPAWVLGLLDLRGHYVPVVDVTARLSNSARTSTLTDVIVVAHRDGRRIGLLVQDVLSVFDGTAKLDDVTDAIPHAGYMQSVVHQDREPVFLFDVERLVGHAV